MVQMKQSAIQQDITIAVRQALHQRLDQLGEPALMQHSDLLLATLPGMRGAQPLSTAQLLLRYGPSLAGDVCRGNLAGIPAEHVQDRLGRLTRAVLLSVGVGEGVSVEIALGIALVLYKRDSARCAARSRASSPSGGDALGS